MESFEELQNSITNCTKCKLCNARKHIVFGDGNIHTNIMFIGEGPGADEDSEGLPFVGKAGKLMDLALVGVGINRKNLYIANIVKCRPPSNRVPEADEIEACLPYLQNQIKFIQPKVIVLLGSTALKSIFGNQYNITASRGHWIEKDGIMYMPTWHPAALLRNETKKIDFWKDLKMVTTKYTN